MMRLSESKSKLACIFPSVSIFAVFRRQRYDDSVKPAFLFSSTFLPISFKNSIHRNHMYRKEQLFFADIRIDCLTSAEGLGGNRWGTGQDAWSSNG